MNENRNLCIGMNKIREENNKMNKKRDKRNRMNKRAMNGIE